MHRHGRSTYLNLRHNILDLSGDWRSNIGHEKRTCHGFGPYGAAWSNETPSSLDLSQGLNSQESTEEFYMSMGRGRSSYSRATVLTPVPMAFESSGADLYSGTSRDVDPDLHLSRFLLPPCNFSQVQPDVGFEHASAESAQYWAPLPSKSKSLMQSNLSQPIMACPDAFDCNPNIRGILQGWPLDAYRSPQCDSPCSREKGGYSTGCCSLCEMLDGRVASFSLNPEVQGSPSAAGGTLCSSSMSIIEDPEAFPWYRKPNTRHLTIRRLPHLRRLHAIHAAVGKRNASACRKIVEIHVVGVSKEEFLVGIHNGNGEDS
ncbi:hypothetical protein BV25DRAFT_1837427 [Artomyces pyxidatus]|uniref:Uncharacterized protein n=1 Tax=Artomyces pyxidatus TaxID=48021 RepID=A0ACB8T561_9AGAM|nr:hypothetical protein BV25DRAFT_1837427 [Artomyces pyxidatus]